MNQLEINYSVSKNLKLLATFSGVYLFAISVGVSVFQAIAKEYSFFFYAGLAGALIGVALVFVFAVLHSKPIIVIDNEQFQVHLPKQRVDGAIDWENVKQIGIGLSYITMAITDGKNYKIDLENLKYVDLRAIKTKLIEICEARSIPYNNV